MNKVNPFTALTAPFPVILFSNFFIVFEAAFKAILLNNSGKSFLAKGIARSVTTLLSILPNQEPRN